MFTNNCLIQKNTPELRAKLLELGRVEEQNNGNSDYYDCILCYEDKFIQLDVFDPIDLVELKEDEYTNCLDNEKSFLAIASLRDDSDINQWFILDANVSWASENFHPKGYFVFCKRNKWYLDLDKDGKPSIFSSRNIPAHKATVEELIEHFKNR